MTPPPHRPSPAHHSTPFTCLGLAVLLALAGAAPPGALSQTPAPWYSPGGAGAPDGSPTDLGAAAAEVDEIFEAFDSSETPGCAVGVARSGEPILSRAYGMADLETPKRNSPSTRFEAGSVSKQFAAAAVILLEQDGELSLDDDIRDHVPEVPDYGEPITLHHLMTHTSGLRDWGSVAAISGWGRGARSHNHHHVVDIISRQSKLNFPTGERYSYSNSGYNLLSVVVERVTGGSLDDFTQERIFEPLGMTRTSWRDDYREIQVGRAAAYSDHGNGRYTINRPIEHVHGNGGLLTTVGDLLAWNRELQTGRVLGEAFVERMHTPGRLNDGREVNYAAGLRRGGGDGPEHINHTGATSGYRAYLGRFPEEELSVAVLCNVTSASAGSRGIAVADLFLDAPLAGEEGEDEDEELATVDVPRSLLEERTGYYRSELDNSLLRLEVDEGALRVVDGPELAPVERDVFRRGSGETYYHFEPVEGEDRDGIRVTEAREYDDERYVPVERFDPSTQELRAYEGTYWSEDAETEVEVRVEGDELVIHRSPDDTLTLEPVYTDAFRGFARVRFLRDEGGEVTGFTRGAGRVYDMRFERVER